MSISKRSKQLFLKADLVELIKIFDRESSAILIYCIYKPQKPIIKRVSTSDALEE